MGSDYADKMGVHEVVFPALVGGCVGRPARAHLPSQDPGQPAPAPALAVSGLPRPALRDTSDEPTLPRAIALMFTMVL